MTLISTQRLAEVYDHDLDLNMGWIRNKFQLKPTALIKFKGEGERAIFIVIPSHEVMDEFKKDNTNDIKLFNEYKQEMWGKIKIFSLHQFHIKNNKVKISMERKLNLKTIITPPGSQIRDFEDYQYLED